jgi:hypothetical protein
LNNGQGVGDIEIVKISSSIVLGAAKDERRGVIILWKKVNKQAWHLLSALHYSIVIMLCI